MGWWERKRLGGRDEREREKDAADDEWLGSCMSIFSAEPLIV